MSDLEAIDTHLAWLRKRLNFYLAKQYGEDPEWLHCQIASMESLRAKLQEKDC